MISFVAAVAENRVIGKDNKLIWHIPEDLAIFKKITYGKTIIMGRKTFANHISDKDKLTGTSWKHPKT